MADKASSVSPYLLRPLRTLEQVLGGCSGATQPGAERAEGRLQFNSRDALCKVADEERAHPARPPDRHGPP
jgi:hypothetical protein